MTARHRRPRQRKTLSWVTIRSLVISVGCHLLGHWFNA